MSVLAAGTVLLATSLLDIAPLLSTDILCIFFLSLYRLLFVLCICISHANGNQERKLICVNGLHKFHDLPVMKSWFAE